MKNISAKLYLNALIVQFRKYFNVNCFFSVYFSNLSLSYNKLQLSRLFPLTLSGYTIYKIMVYKFF